MAGMTLNAQSETAKKSCSKTCAKTCSKSAKTANVDADATKVASQMTEAEIAAEGVEDIKVKTCSVSGTKSFYQKTVAADSGDVSWDEVQYCTKSKKFTKVAAASMERDVEVEASSSVKPAKKACSKSCAKKCAKKASM